MFDSFAFVDVGSVFSESTRLGLFSLRNSTQKQLHESGNTFFIANEHVDEEDDILFYAHQSTL